MSLPNFFYRDEMASYCFGDQHPLKPERLRRTLRLLKAESAIDPIPPDPASEETLLLVHSRDYIEAVKHASSIPMELADDPDRFDAVKRTLVQYGLGTSDNPIFSDMHEKSLHYVGGGVAAATAIVDGARLSFNISGGLHHATASKASGFCVYNDPAIMVRILLKRFERVAYVDIDLHHGDGVQQIFCDDPSVLTVSIHETGETLYPGTGFTSEVGTPEPHCVNIPLEAFTTGDVWVDAFERVVPKVIRNFSPGAIVLQMGADPHFSDPLGHLRVTAQEWLHSVKIVRDLGLPIAACGGGGYNLLAVPRMWAAACMTLGEHTFGPMIPESVRDELEVSHYFDEHVPTPRETGRTFAEETIQELEQLFDLAN